MAEQEPVGSSQEFIQEYLQRVGAVDFEEPTSGPSTQAVGHLAGVEAARAEWIESCKRAAEDELQFWALMGHPSHIDTKEAKVDRHTREIDYPGIVVRSEYQGYGRTSAAHAAVANEQELRAACESADEAIQTSTKISDLEKVVMHAVLRRGYPENPAQKNSLEYGAKALGLIEEAQIRGDQPLVMVRRRWYTPRSVGGNPEKLDMSDLITAEGFELVPANNELQMVLRGVSRVVFEHYSTRRVGTTRGLIGSGYDESGWRSIDKKDMEVEEIESLKAIDLLSPSQVTANKNDSFSALKTIHDNDPSVFSDLDDFREPYGGMGKNDPFSDPGNETGFFVASSVDLEDLEPPKGDDKLRAFRSGNFARDLTNAQKVLLDNVNPSRRGISRRMTFLLK